MSSANSQPVAMDVDGPSSGPGTLKRCSSAPMINESSAVMTSANASFLKRDHQPYSFGTSPQTRTRRFSASSSHVSGLPALSPHPTPRINQLRQEEHEGISNTRELAHEREIHHAMQISLSCEDLSIMNDSNEASKSNKTTPLQVTLPIGGIFTCNSPSPTRIGFPSPTRSRTIVRRSASPVLRPSPLGVKRKLDDDKLDYLSCPRAKRLYSGRTERGGLLTTTGGSLSSIGTPESLSSADSPSFNNFRTIDSPSPGQALPMDNISVTKNDQEMTESPS